VGPGAGGGELWRACQGSKDGGFEALQSVVVWNKGFIWPRKPEALGSNFKSNFSILLSKSESLILIQHWSNYYKLVPNILMTVYQVYIDQFCDR